MARTKVDREAVKEVLRELMQRDDHKEIIAALSSPIAQKIQALDPRSRAHLDDLLYCIGHGAPVAVPKKRGRPVKKSAAQTEDAASF